MAKSTIQAALFAFLSVGIIVVMAGHTWSAIEQSTLLLQSFRDGTSPGRLLASSLWGIPSSEEGLLDHLVMVPILGLCLWALYLFPTVENSG